jgi:hypothetical protein
MSIDCPPLSALPESSTMSGPSSSSHQPRTPGRAPGNHTPRHVQWASAIDEEEVAGRQRDCELESEVASTHELDEAGLDVRMVCSADCFLYSLYLLFTANRLPNTYPCSRTPSLIFRIILHTVPTVTIIYILLRRVVPTCFSETSHV